MQELNDQEICRRGGAYAGVLNAVTRCKWEEGASWGRLPPLEWQLVFGGVGTVEGQFRHFAAPSIGGEIGGGGGVCGKR